MNRLKASVVGIALLVTLGLGASKAEEACTASDYAAAVDRSGAVLSQASRDMQPKIQERMRRYKEVSGLADGDYEGAALEAIHDKRLEDLDAKSSELILKIDGLGRLPPGKAPSCAEISDIDAMAQELLGVVRTKSDYIVQRLDAAIAQAQASRPSGRTAGNDSPAKEKAPAGTRPAAKPDEARQAAAARPKPDDAYRPPAPPVVSGTDGSVPPADGPEYVPIPQDAQAAQAQEAGYSIDEIREATKGFFGPISAGLASVIEHAFKTSGRPAAYVLGSEGGGAFLAGLRFGKGTLYMRDKPQTRTVWWHGPSIGGDFGASGTRTMFLIYRLPNEEALFRRFTGVDGSAFLVGGVGMTVLKGGEVIMAPIRTGLGLRVGASVGYLRFTPEQTWNPF